MKNKIDKEIEKLRLFLKRQNLKFSIQREIILRCLHECKTHVTPEDLHLIVKQKYPAAKIGIATVYRTLSMFETIGLTLSLSFGSQGKKYEINSNTHHDHLICDCCGKIVEFVDETIEKKQKEVVRKMHFVMTGHSMQIYGICPDCQ